MSSDERIVKRDSELPIESGRFRNRTLGSLSPEEVVALQQTLPADSHLHQAIIRMKPVNVTRVSSMFSRGDGSNNNRDSNSGNGLFD